MKKATYLVLAVIIILGAQLFSPSPGRVAERKDVFASASVWIELAGTQIPLVAVKGIGNQSDISIAQATPAQPGERKDYIPAQKFPGKLKVSDIVIKKYATPGPPDVLYLWRLDAMAYKQEFRKNGAIVFKDPQGNVITRYNFYYAWPSEWKGIVVDGQSPFPVEEYTLVVERVERVVEKTVRIER
jgi:phage tail-like protein